MTDARPSEELDQNWLTTVLGFLPFISGLATAGVAMSYQMGPWWFWANDACPNDPNTICGLFPVGPMLFGLAGLVMAYVLLGVVAYV